MGPREAAVSVYMDHAKSLSPNSLHRHLAQSGSFVVLGRLVGLALTFASHGLLTRILPPADYGQFSLFLSITLFSGLVGRFGLDQALLRAIPEAVAHGRTTEAVTLARKGILISSATAVLTAGVVAVAALPVGRIAGFDLTISLALMAAFATILLSVCGVMLEVLRGFHQISRAAAYEVTATGPIAAMIFLVCATLVHLTLGLDLVRTVGVYVLSITITGGLMLTRIKILVPKLDGPGSTHQPLSGFGRMALAFWLLLIISYSWQQLDLWIVAMWGDGTQVALFAAAKRISHFVLLWGVLANKSFSASISHLHAQQRWGEASRVLRVAVVLSGVPALAIAGMVFFFPSTMMRLAFGPFYEAGATICMILTTAAGVSCVLSIGGYALLVTGYHKAVLYTDAGVLLLMLSLGKSAWNWNGMEAIALLAAFALTARSLLLFLLAHQVLGFWNSSTLPVAEEHSEAIVAREGS